MGYLTRVEVTWASVNVVEGDSVVCFDVVCGGEVSGGGEGGQVATDDTAAVTFPPAVALKLGPLTHLIG